MYCKRIILIAFAVWINSAAKAQMIDPVAIYNSISGDHYFRVNYDNDFFTKMDYYYSQGISLEYVDPALRKFPLTKLLVKLAGSSQKYGIALDHAAYTPTSIAASDILFGDRPYAAAITLKTFTISIDNKRNQRLSSSLVVGMLGPSAFGEEMQTGIHTWLNNPLPMGWQHQIKNDFILNYQLNYEKRILNAENTFQAGLSAELRAGSFQQKLKTGLTIMAGHFNDPYQNNHPRKKMQYYFFGYPHINVIGYDGTLQGGLFNRKSPYIISAGDINRIVFQADAGITVSTGKTYLTYSQSIMSKEFSTGAYHRWGGFRLGISL